MASCQGICSVTQRCPRLVQPLQAQELLDAARPLQQRILPQHGNFLELPRPEVEISGGPEVRMSIALEKSAKDVGRNRTTSRRGYGRNIILYLIVFQPTTPFTAEEEIGKPQVNLSLYRCLWYFLSDLHFYPGLTSVPACRGWKRCLPCSLDGGCLPKTP